LKIVIAASLLTNFLVTVNKEYLYAWILHNPTFVKLLELDFIRFKLKNDHEATVFQTWHKGHKISRMLNFQPPCIKLYYFFPKPPLKIIFVLVNSKIAATRTFQRSTSYFINFKSKRRTIVVPLNSKVTTACSTHK